METTQESTKKLTREDFYNIVFNAEGREAKRELLKDLSNTAKMIMDNNPEAGETINEVILNCMYKSDTHQEFNTFKNWKEKGFKVKKGAKSFFIWSKPRDVTRKAKNEGEDDKDFKMFGIAYLFSNAQVEAIEE